MASITVWAPATCCVEGKFSTAILQVPVEGGHEGGRFNVEYNRKNVAFENHGNSDNNFDITAMLQLL